MASRGRVDHARGGHDAGVPCRTRADEALLLLTPVYTGNCKKLSEVTVRP